MLLKKSVRKEFLHTSGDGKNHKIKYYYLDDINTIKNILSRLNENSLSKSKTKSIAIEQLKQMLEEKLAILNREN